MRSRRSGSSRATAGTRATVLSLADGWLVIAYGFCVLAAQVLAAGSAVRLALALPLFVFVSGYALVVALFPTDDATTVRAPRLAEESRVLSVVVRPQRRDFDGVERAGLAVGLSVALTVLFGVVYSSVLGTLAGGVPAFVGLVIALALVGIGRRLRLPADRRFTVPFGRWIDTSIETVRALPNREPALNVLLAASILLAAAALGFGFVAPQDGEPHTEFALGTTTDDGEFVTADYPTEIDAGDEPELAVYLQQYENPPRTYTVVAVLQRVDEDDEVTEAAEVNRLTVEVPPDEPTVERHSIEPSMHGEDLRLTYHLYEGDPPDELDETGTSADDTLHVWIDVAEDAVE